MKCHVARYDLDLILSFSIKCIASSRSLSEFANKVAPPPPSFQERNVGLGLNSSESQFHFPSNMVGEHLW